MPIHKTAIIHSDANLAPDVTVGPFAIIEAGAHLHSGCKVFGHAYVGPGTEVGSDSEIHMHAVVGHDPQDVTWAREPSRVVIGERTVLREYVSVHRASKPGADTRIGNDCLLMVGAHVAHDCQVADGVMMANHCSLAGHAEVGMGAFLSANTLVHQFCRVGRLVMLGGAAVAVQDIPPFMLSTGDRATIRGVNVVGLRRAGFEPDLRRSVQDAHRILYRSGRTIPEAAQLLEQSQVDEVREIARFIDDSARGIASGSGVAVDPRTASV
ncbi:MAG: acyl-ACP--UDP-N-acetylglucosamine O-acyltransferase [Planctomycetota bacterium]|nr:acyl-ACP--UDP-N-acetylglucosamine O-acyltransferase [Planctomycetota bacterium]